MKNMLWLICFEKNDEMEPVSVYAEKSEAENAVTRMSVILPFNYHIEPVVNGIAAETKAQQDCPYCHESKVIVGDSDLQANVMIHLGSLFVVPKIIKPMGNMGSGQGISYCPMCGRKVDAFDC
ncbi:hypothetical protein IWT25_02310 [Secundilactobacillus pentosiphilus]|uniref:Uncharacterized protein n=1 Tax=Secundilactobacillus pentosiphilus TaxID=1714682 RepID=A0A1Z5IZG3_9LACO|nr:hypothetical protein [Secundilactobacillus pentosiphilus]GAX06962.1 hypothetical protein IWT25_02310 [Secundilactobacillus pentosiphilus]